MNKVLIVDASTSSTRGITAVLKKAGYSAVIAEDFDATKEEVAKLPPGAVIIAANKFRNGTIQELINWQKEEGYQFPVIAIVDNLNGAEIVEVMRDGGAVNVIQRLAIDKQLVEMVNRYVTSESSARQPMELIHRPSESFRKIQRSILAIASTNANAVVFGECGTGKEQIAHQIYAGSSRTQKPCTIIEAGGAALVGCHDPATLRSEVYNRISGYFQKADGGTIIIKNVQLLSFDKQSVLLHILENEHPDVRVICTAEPELLEMVAAKIFRPNLFYILRQVDIIVPALRDTIEDIVPLANHFLHVYADKFHQPVKRLSASAKKALKTFPFTGNVRELRDLVMFATLNVSGDVIAAEDLNFSQSVPPVNNDLKLINPSAERLKIVSALQQSDGNKSIAAKLLGIARSTLDSRLKKYGLK